MANRRRPRLPIDAFPLKKHSILLKDVAARLLEYGLTPWNVTRRIKRMNDKLDKLIGQKVAEKRGKGWALTTFLREASGSTIEQMTTNALMNT